MSIRGPSTVGDDPAMPLTRRCNGKASRTAALISARQPVPEQAQGPVDALDTSTMISAASSMAVEPTRW